MATEAGVYLACLSFRITLADAKYVTGYISSSGDGDANVTLHGRLDTAISVMVATFCFLDVADDIYGQVYHNTGTDETLTDFATTLSIYKMA